MKKSLLTALALGLALSVAACGNTVAQQDSPADAASDSGAAGTSQEISLETASGVLHVTMPAGDQAPQIRVADTPYSVKATQVKTLKEGSGPVVAADATVSVDYLGVNGRDGKSFDSSYERGSAATFPLYGVVPGFAKAIAGQKVGSDVIVAMTPEDGYGTQGNPQAGIEGTDTLIFFIHINEIAQ